MKIKWLENISKNTIEIALSNGQIINLPPKGILENIEVSNLGGYQRSCKIIYQLND
jgi:hypothetical protein